MTAKIKGVREANREFKEPKEGKKFTRRELVARMSHRGKAKGFAPVKITLKVPKETVQMFRVMQAVFMMDAEGLALKALTSWLKSEEAVEAFDKILNRRK